MPQPPSRHPIDGQPISTVVGRATAIVDSAEANVSMPRLSNGQLNEVMADFTKIAEDAKRELEAEVQSEQEPDAYAPDR